LPNVMLGTGIAALPVFVTVTGCAALAVPTCTLPKANDVGNAVNGTAPVPLTTTVFEPEPPLPVTLRLENT